jgi:hypothetical protein
MLRKLIVTVVHSDAIFVWRKEIRIANIDYWYLVAWFQTKCHRNPLIYSEVIGVGNTDMTILSRILVTKDAGLDWWIDLLDIHKL